MTGDVDELCPTCGAPVEVVSAHEGTSHYRAVGEGERTPATIVRDAERPLGALAAFVGQELEHWGFDVEVTPAAGGSVVFVDAAGRKMIVAVMEPPA